MRARPGVEQISAPIAPQGSVEAKKAELDFRAQWRPLRLRVRFDQRDAIVSTWRKLEVLHCGHRPNLAALRTILAHPDSVSIMLKSY